METKDGMERERDSRNVNIEIKKELNELENDWHSCCGSIIDKRLLEFCTKTMVILFVLLFCVIRILTHDNKEENNIYFNFIVLIAGSFLPSPSLKIKK